MSGARKNWDQYVTNAEEIARTPGFRALKDQIVRLSGSVDGLTVADIGSGTGLLTLEMAPTAEKIWAIDISERMAGYLKAKASSAKFTNVETVVASAASLPLVDESVDVVVSNYCFHHLSEEGKRSAINEVFRVLRPGGKFVFGDMMFNVSVVDARDRKLLASKVRAILSRGVPGLIRVLKNVILFVTGRWEQPARSEWWTDALTNAGFSDVRVEALEHEGGVASAMRPMEDARVGDTAPARESVETSQITT
ncbi:MAG: methyltransferase domain-containing protein [Solirubrobacterales bacterium]|nr:methyltransferase domain-containing protein [Solirubrobacterales bacterium]